MRECFNDLEMVEALTMGKEQLIEHVDGMSNN